MNEYPESGDARLDFAVRGAAVLDCANGYQEKNQEEVKDSC
jgi:hypothetical protein